jgi:prepilin-type processing-associated H-X9-DG protein
MDAEIDKTATTNWLDGAFQLKMSGSEPLIDPVNGQRMAMRHNDGSNFTFADFHTEYKKWKDPRTKQYFDGQIDSAAASSNNDDLKWLFDAIKGD